MGIWIRIDESRPQDRGKGTLHLKDVAVCTDFNTNSVSFDQLQGRGYCWDNKRENNFLGQAWPEKATQSDTLDL
jgi:hypothetical protein